MAQGKDRATQTNGLLRQRATYVQRVCDPIVHLKQSNHMTGVCQGELHQVVRRPSTLVLACLSGTFADESGSLERTCVFPALVCIGMHVD